MSGGVRGSRRRGSGYRASHPKELERLRLQATFVESLDERALAVARAHLGRRPLVAVDVGCADGALTRSRFADDVFVHVVGVDADPILVERASSGAAGSKFHFLHVDVEQTPLDEVLGRYFAARDLPGPDLVFSALMLPHLTDPARVLASARRALRSPGVLVVRGADDGSKMAWPDPSHRVERVVELTRSVPSVGDRLNGRKIFPQLRAAGFSDVEMLYHVQDTVGLDPELRAALFRDSFSFRDHHLARAVESSTDPAMPGRLVEMRRLLGELEEAFGRDDFYYTETSYAGVARVP